MDFDVTPPFGGPLEKAENAESSRLRTIQPTQGNS